MASVLIVDDERSMRDFLKILLEKEGHQVTTADSGARALETLKKQTVDVIVSDIRMPGMTGIELLETVKEALTGTAGNYDHRLCLARRRGAGYEKRCF